MAVPFLDITKNWFTGTVVREVNWDNIKGPLTDWADAIVNDLNQIAKDTHGSTYSYDNDGLANLANPIRDWSTGISALAWVFTNTVSLSGTVTLTTLRLNDTSADHYYAFAVSELAANRTVTMPLLAGDDEFVFKDFIQTLTNKTMTTPDINGGSWYGTIDGNWNAAGQTCSDLGVVTTVNMGSMAHGSKRVENVSYGDAATEPDVGLYTLAIGAVNYYVPTIDMAQDELFVYKVVVPYHYKIGSQLFLRTGYTSTKNSAVNYTVATYHALLIPEDVIDASLPVEVTASTNLAHDTTSEISFNYTVPVSDASGKIGGVVVGVGDIIVGKFKRTDATAEDLRILSLEMIW